MIDVPTILVSVLLVATVGVALKYYKVLRRSQKEYEEARGTVESIVLSFDRQLQHEAKRIEATAFKVEALSSKIEGASRNAAQTQDTLRNMELKLAPALQDMGNASLRLDNVEKKVNELVTVQSTFESRISTLDEQAKQFVAIQEPNVQAVIPIRRDKALAALTETELSVLDMLSSGGSKTAPEIKERVKLSREHTARLMKKLYESGYLERDTVKIPFRYSVKKEMAEILKRIEGESA